MAETNPIIVILAAGLGTRMKSARAKVLHRAGGKALVEHVVDVALELTSPERVRVVVGHQAAEVKALLRDRGVGFVDQTEQKGTGHALLSARDQLLSLQGPLVVLYGDAPLITAGTVRGLMDVASGDQLAGAVLITRLDDPTGYGRILLDNQGFVSAIVEQKAATLEQLQVQDINSGIYCFQSNLLWKHILEIQPNNPAREYYLTDIVEIFRRAGHRMAPVRVHDPLEVSGINNRIELADVDRIFRLRKVRQLMLDGVTIEKPETVSIDGAVQIGPDTIIGPFVQLRGRTVIGSNCTVGACSIIEDSELADEVEVGAFTSIGTSRVEKGAIVGPYARLRLSNHVGERAHIGNFVELKKTSFGANAKANHLAYLGDSTIGADVNIGAGTITCNYDGKKKHQTKIGDGAFVGSNSTLVAPAQIGDGAYVGAGSVITSPVPADALALGRARQVLKEGWAKKRKAAEPAQA